MKTNIETTSYWFKIEPYVYVTIAENKALLYNTLDGAHMESYSPNVIKLLSELLQKDNYGVILLTNEKYHNPEIFHFITELRDKYMGDIINTSFSQYKPIQILPYYNWGETHELFKKHNFFVGKKILTYLSEISIYFDKETDAEHLILYLQSLPEGLKINLIGNIKEISDYNRLLDILNQIPSLKKLICFYDNIIMLPPEYEKGFSYTILVHLPLDITLWNKSRSYLFNQNFPYEYIFEVSSYFDCQQAYTFIEKFEIDKYQLKPIYTGDNIDFFRDEVFLSREDILSEKLSIKDIFLNQAINIYDFGKLNILPNGDIYANIHFPALGNIKTHSIYDVVLKELEEGKSWLRIRNQAPCNNCIFQWLCPSPSDYEITIGRPNLCNVKL